MNPQTKMNFLRRGFLKLSHFRLVQTNATEPKLLLPASLLATILVHLLTVIQPWRTGSWEQVVAMCLAL